jgi:hypothetical protein
MGSNKMKSQVPNNRNTRAILKTINWSRANRGLPPIKLPVPGQNKRRKNVYREALIAKIRLPRESAEELIDMGLYRISPELRRTCKCGARIPGTDRTCKAQAMQNGRCRRHGGLSTGPKTEAGKKRAAEARKAARSLAETRSSS